MYKTAPCGINIIITVSSEGYYDNNLVLLQMNESIKYDPVVHLTCVKKKLGRYFML